MSENNNKKYISFLTKISRKIHPRFSLHYAVYTVLSLFLTFSIVGIVTATTPNPGHPWTEVGDGNVIFSDPGAARTYTLPTVNATLLSTGIGLSGGTTLIGGTATTDQLILRSTSGAGTTGADIIFQTGNNGATEVGRFLNNGKFKLTQYGSGTNTGTATYSLQVDASGNVIEGSAATGVTALSAIGSSPNANGATITGSTLNLEPASASFGGVVTTGSQTFAGAKVFNSTITTGTTGTAGSVTFNRSSDGTSMGTIAASSAYLTLNGTTGIELGGTSTNGVRITSAGTWIGRASISNANPTAFLTLAAGTSAASSAPLKFTSGTNLSSAEAGAVEWDGTQLYLTSSVPTRNIVAQVAGATALSTGAVYATTNGYLTSTAPTSGTLGYWSRSGTTLSPATANDIVTLSSTNLSSGSLLDISVNSTAAASNTQKVINISTTGTNGTAGQTTYGGYFANTHDGSTSTNIGAYFTASGGTTTNWSAFFNERINVGNATNDANHALIVRSLDNTANHGIKITANNQTTSMEIGYNTISTGGGLILSPGTTTGLQVSGSGAFMYVGGAVTPTARVHIAAGTATAGQAPLKFTSGTNLSSAEAGAVEWDGTQLYLTSSVPTRNIVAQVAGATALSTGAVYATTNGYLTSTAPTSGTLGYWSRSGTTLSPATANDIVTVSTNSTTASNKAIEALQTGATSGTDYAGYFSNTGTATTNIGLYATASGATNNYAAIFEAGNVGIGTTAPSAKLNIIGTTEQVRIGYDATKYFTTTVSSAGTVAYELGQDSSWYWRNGVGSQALFIAGTADNFETILRSSDGDAQVGLTLRGDLVGNNVTFFLSADDDTNPVVSIAGDGINGTLDYTADTHTFSGDVLLGGGLASTGCTATDSTGAFACTSTISSGVAGGTIGGINISGNTSGTISINPQAAAGTYNFNLPTTAGNSGEILTSAGGAGSPMTWTAPGALAVRWNSIVDPTGDQTLSFDAGEENIWTVGATTADFWTMTANSLTIGKVLSIDGGNAMTTGNILTLTGNTYAHTANETGSLMSLAFTDATTTTNTSTTNGLLVSPTVNVTAGASGIKTINGISVTPTFTACTGGSTCNPNGLNIGNVTDGTGITSAGIRVGTGWDYAAIFEAGNVGIGTTTPTSPFEVVTTTTSLIGAKYDFDSLTSGTGLRVRSLSADASSNSQKLLDVTLSGTNTNSNQSTIAASISNSHSGTNSSNYALFVAASSGTNNYALVTNGGNVGIGDITPEALFTVGSGDLFQINTTGQIGSQQAPVSDYLFALAGTTGNDHSRIIDITQANNADESTSAITIVGTQSPGTIAANRSIDGIANSLTLGNLTVNSKTATISGTNNTISLPSTVIIGTTTLADAEVNTAGNRISVTGSPDYFDAGGGSFQNLYAYGVNSSVSLSPTITSIVDARMHTYAGYFTNTSTSPGNSGLNSQSYGILATTSGNLTTSGVTSHYGGYFSASGTADNNYGVYIDTISGATNNYALITAGGNVGIGDTTPLSLLTVGASDAFQVNSSGAIAAATGITSSGTITFSGLGTSSAVYTNGSSALTTTAPTSGAIGYWSRASTTVSPTTITDEVNIGNATDIGAYILQVTGEQYIQTPAGQKGLVMKQVSGGGAGNEPTISFSHNTTGYGSRIGMRDSDGGLHFDVQNSSVWVDNALVIESGTADVGIGAGTNPLYRLDVLKATTGQTASNRVANFSNAGATFDTTSGNLSSYGGYFSSTSTESAGGNVLTNIGLYATASGADTNYAAIFEAGNVGIGTTSPLMKLDITNGTQVTGANQDNPTVLNVTGANNTLTGGAATAYIVSNTAQAADTGGSIAFSGLTTTGDNDSVNNWAIIKGAKENSTTTNQEGYLAFAVRSHAAGNVVERMRINSAGELQIGSTTDLGAYKLQVTGDTDQAGDFYSTSSGTIKAKIASSNGLISAGPGGINIARSDVSTIGVSDASITYSSADIVLVNKNLAVSGGVYGTSSYSISTNNITIGYDMISASTNAGTGDSYRFDTAGAQTAGNLLNLKNNTTSKFSVDYNGAITSASLTSGGTQCLQANSSGVISGTGSACGSGGVTNWDTIGDPSAGADINFGTTAQTITSTATTQNPLSLIGNSLTTGSLFSLTSTSTALTSGGLLNISATGAPASSWTGSLGLIEYNNADVDVDGSALKLGLKGAAGGEGTTLNITTEQTGTNALALRVNDDGTYTDSTPFVINASGNVGINSTAPQYLLHVGAGTDASDAGSTMLAIFENAGSSSISIRDAANNSEAYIYADSGGVNFGSVTNHPVQIGAGTGTSIFIDTSNNVNIGGDITPNSLFTVGGSSEFQVNSSGAIVAATGITSSGTITFSGLSTTGIVHNNSSGVLSTSLVALGDLLTQGTATDEFCLTSETGGGALLAWQACGGGAPAWDTITAPTTSNLSLAHGAFTTDFTFNSVTTATAFALSSSSLTTGKLFDLSSSSTTLTTGGLLNITHSGVPGSSWTGDLAKIESTGASTANLDGNLLKLGYTGTAGASDGTVLNITSTQTGSSSYLFRANDDGTYTDSTPFVVDANGQIGVQTTSLSDYLVSLTGTTSNDNSRVLDITQANDAAEDSFGIALNITSNPGTLTGVTRNVRGISNTVNPTATIGDESEFFVNGIQVSTSSSNVTFNAAPGGNTSTFRGILAVSSGSPTINISSGTDTTIESSGVFGSSGLTPVLTSVSATTVLNSYGGRFSDSTSTAGDANLTVTAYGVQGQTFGNLTTTGTTTHYGGYFNATGTADTNYGIYATATSGTTNYAGYFVGDVSVTGHILPGTNDTYDLGSDSLRWRDLYLGGETLHLGTSTTDEGTIAYTTSSNILNFGTDSTSNGDISFFTDDLYLDKSAARVGINTTGPGASLHITQNTASADATLVIEDTNGANDVRMQFRTPADTGTGFSGIARGQVLYAIGHGASGASGWADYEGRPLIFYTGCDDLVCNAVAERMRIIQTGEVNIGGDATPNAMFTVGSTSQFQVNSSGAIAAATGIISSGTIQFSALTTNGAVYTSGGNGTLTTTAPTSGAIGYWSRATTTLSPTTANDIVSIPTTNTTGADLAITNTGVYTGTGIFNLTANSATTGALASITGNGLTSGSLLSLSSNGAAAANGQKGLSVTLAGNIGTSITTYAGYFDNSHTRTAGTPLNVGVYGNATSGGADNYGVYGSATGGNVNAAGFFTNDGDGYNPTTIVTNSSTATNGYTQMAIRGGQEWTVGVGNTNETALGLASKFFVYYPFGGIVPLTIDTSGNVGIGDTTPSAMFSVGATSQFQVNSSGAIAAATGITMTSGDIITSNLGVNYTDSDTNPGCAAGEYKIFADTSETKLKKCTNGTVTDMDTTGGGGTAWSDITVPTGNLTLAMDADLTTFNYDTLTTQNAFTLASTSITSGTLFNLTSTSTAVTSAGLLNIQATGAPAASWTGDLAKIEYNNADADVDGTALKLGLLGAAAGDGTTLNITNQQTGTNALALRVNDDGTYTDSTPFVVDVAGNVGIKTTSATSTLTVAGNAEFTTSGTSGFTFTNATASSSSGVLRLNATSSSDFVSSARFSTTQTATGSLTASYGLQNFWTSTAVVAGASVGQTTYGIFNAASKSGADTATGTYNLYASYNTADNTGRTDAGTVNTYGGYFSTLGDTAGASTAYGIYATASGADNNYAGIFANGNVGVGDATPTSLFTVGASDAFQVNSSGAITAATGVTSSGVIAANGGITVATGQQIGASNFGIEFAESDTNPTCAAGNFNIYADLSENKLKKCTNGTVTDLDTTGGGGLSDADYGDIVVSSSGTVMSIDADVIDWADISDTTTLDASTSIAFGASTFGLTFTNNGSGNETHNLSSTGDFVIQDNGVSALTVDDGGSVTLGQASTDTGQLVFANSSNGNTVTIQAGATSGSYTWTLPTADAAGCLKSDGAGTMSIGSCGDAKSEIFTANGNYTMPSDARIVIVDVIGGGGGGGGGGRNAAGTTHTGGGGGGGGAYATRTFSATAVSSPVTITVPAGATGGVGSNANGSNGNQGAIGTKVSFGSLLTGYGGGGGGSGKAVGAAPATGGGGGGGTGATGSNGGTSGGAGGLPLGAAASAGTDGFAGGGGGTGASAGGGSMYGGGGGGGTNNNGAAAGSAGGTSYRGGGGGGGGGGANAANAGQAGGAGGKSPGTANSGGGGAAGAANNAGTAGANAGTDITTGANGGGGGGGGGGTTGAGGAGGNGGVPGGGGGGGGAGTAANGGTGGAGGRGQVQVWTIRGAGAADLAETYPTNEADLGVADVVVFDPELPLGVKRSTVPYDRNAVGIVSTTPNMVMGGEVTEGGVKSVPIGLSGRVPVRVTSMNGPIKPGDYLTTSSLPGVAMKATKAGTIIGRSLGTYTGGNGENHDMGIVIAFIQNGYYNGESLVDVASVPGLEPDIGPPVDFSKKLLGKLVSDLAGQDDVSLGASPLNVSDLYIDKLAAAIEIVTPSVVTNKLSVDNISPSMGKDIGLMLGPDGKFTIGSLETTTTVTNPDGTETVTIESSPPAIIFDSLGNATFAGTLTAKEIKIGDVSAIEEITEQINTLAEGQVAFTLTAQVMNTLSTALTLAQADILKLQTDMATTSESIAGLTTSGTDIDTRLKIVEGFLTKDADGVVNGFAINMLSVSGDSAFAGKAQFDGLSFFSNTTSFTGGVTFAGQTEFLVPPLYNKDSAGYALIKEGDKKVQVTFSEPYIATPVVNTSITFEEDDSIDDTKAQTFFTNDIRFIIVGKNQNGFTILLNKQAPRDIRFSWNALSVKDPSIFESVFEGLVIEPTLPTPEGDGTPTDNVGADPTTEPDETPAPDPIIEPDPTLPTPEGDGTPTDNVGAEPAPEHEEAPQPEGGVI